MAKRKMILDLDTGVDDALAIAYALADPEVDLIGIVSSYGNNLLDVCAENSLKLWICQIFWDAPRPWNSRLILKGLG